MKFSLRALLSATALIALLAAIFFAFPPILAAISLMLLIPVMSSALVSGACYGTGDIRAFCIGSLALILPAVGFIVAILLVDVGFELLDGRNLTHQDWESVSDFLKLSAAFITVPSLPSGLTGVAVRRLLLCGQPESRSASPDERLF